MAAELSREDLAREARLPRNLVLAGRNGAPIEDLRDCATVLMKSGQSAAAQCLFDVAEFVAGSFADHPAIAGVTNWAVAVDELSRLMSVAEMRSPPALVADWTTPDPSTTTICDPEWLAHDFSAAVRALLRAEPQTSSMDQTAPILLMKTALSTITFDLAALRPEPTELAMALAFNVMRRALIRRSGLLLPPHGSVSLFRSVRRLTPFGLGVGFEAIPLLAPTFSEMGLLIAEAWRRAPRQTNLAATIDRFVVLLAIGLPPAALRGLVDALADAGKVRVLQGLLIDAERQSIHSINHDALRALRDALLDLGDLPLAVEAQRCLARALGQTPAEQIAQGELEASLRNRASADPERKVMRRSGFASTAAQRARRFATAATAREIGC
jgi:hypothetical protein